MRHVRSPEALARRHVRSAARRYVMESSFRDKKGAESINLVTEEQVRSHLEEMFGAINPNVIPLLVKGEVLLDSRGRGSFQK